MKGTQKVPGMHGDRHEPKQLMFFSQQRLLKGSSAQISSGVLRCSSPLKLRKVPVRFPSSQVPEGSCGAQVRFRAPVWFPVPFPNQVPELSGKFRCSGKSVLSGTYHVNSWRQLFDLHCMMLVNLWYYEIDFCPRFDFACFFSPNSVPTLRGSYGKCKGRCLIRVLQLLSGILSVHVRIK